MKVMFRTFVCSMLFLLFGFIGTSNATIIDFEDSTGNSNKIADNYLSDGVIFDDTWIWFTTSISNYNANSGLFSAIGMNLHSGGSTITFSNVVSDVGAHFNNYLHDLEWAAYDSGDTLLGSIQISAMAQPNITGMIYYELSYDNISYVRLTGTSSALYNLDDLSFASPVPEPATMLLFGLGLLGLAGVNRRKR